MITVHVDLANRSYPIYIGRGLLSRLFTFIQQHSASEEIVFITDEHVRALYLDSAVESLAGAGLRPVFLSVPAGENSKSLSCADGLYTQLIQHRVHRHALIVALGGGVIGDLAGFVASTYMRGVPFVQVPTTILSQVDSSVGGKVGVNHSLGKNMIGAFYQPTFVLIDPLVLTTLDVRQRRAGLAEVVKYGFICDRDLYLLLCGRLGQLADVSDFDVMEQVLASCCRIKAQVVSEDETEEGIRAILNFGHTLGHALEALTDYRVFLHGEAVLHGMRAALHLSQSKGLLDASQSGAGLELIAQLHPPRIPQDASLHGVTQAMQADKKRSAKGQLWVLLQDIGHACLTYDVQQKDVLAAIEFMLAA